MRKMASFIVVFIVVLFLILFRTCTVAQSTPPVIDFANIDQTKIEEILHDAAKKGNIATIEFVIESGYTDLISSKDEDGREPLCYATREGHLNIVILFLQNGADVNAADNHNETALHAAALLKGNQSIAEVLLCYGADIHAKNDAGKDPRDVAMVGECDNSLGCLLTELNFTRNMDFVEWLDVDAAKYSPGSEECKKYLTSSEPPSTTNPPDQSNASSYEITIIVVSAILICTFTILIWFLFRKICTSETNMEVQKDEFNRDIFTIPNVIYKCDEDDVELDGISNIYEEIEYDRIKPIDQYDHLKFSEEPNHLRHGHYHTPQNHKPDNSFENVD